MKPSIELAVVCAASAALLTSPVARACGPFFDDYDPTFMQAVLGTAGHSALAYEPDEPGFDWSCQDCETKEQRDDWAGYLGPTVDVDAWLELLGNAPLPEIDALLLTLEGKPATPPASAKTLLAVKGAAKSRLVGALFYAGFVRRHANEPAQLATVEDDDGNPLPAEPTSDDDLRQSGEAAAARAKTPFLRQRYLFQVVRGAFYARDFAGVDALFEKHGQELDGPSTALEWRARSYLAGALVRSGQRSRGDLELARVFASLTPLAPWSANAFGPETDHEWQDALKLARTNDDKAALWGLVGLRSDGPSAIDQISRLAPSSPLLPLLLVRELAKAERLDEKAQPAAFDAVGNLATRVAGLPGANRRWLDWLVAAHVAALRGDAKTALDLLDKVRAEAPDDAVVQTQQKATRAIALAWTVKQNPGARDEIARLLHGLKAAQDVPSRVTSILWRSADPVDRELLTATRAVKPELLRRMLARVAAAKTPYDGLVVGPTPGTSSRDNTPAGLRKDLVHALVVRGRFAEALAALPPDLHEATDTVDPFVARIREPCTDDCGQYRWDTRKVIERLVELERTARGSGEQAAQAELAIGSALYSTSVWGPNAFQGRGASPDMKAAEARFARAIELSKDRELKVKAAFMAAKCELDADFEVAGAHPYTDPPGYVDPLPVPARWFPVVRQYGDTRYYQEILAECGHFRAWAAHQR